MANQNITTPPAKVQAESLLTECREMIERALKYEVSLHEAAILLSKIEKWEASK